MSLNTPGGAAGGGLVPSSALLIVVLGIGLIFLSHKGISSWLQSRQEAVREHLYGPGELHGPAAADEATPEQAPVDGGEVEQDDDFDYSIFSTGPGQSQ